MKARNAKDYNSNWVQTVSSVIALLFSLLVMLGIVTPEQSTEGVPLFTSTLTAVSSVIAGIIALIGVFFKQGE